MKIKDNSGGIINNLERTNTGCLVVDDSKEYARYKSDLEKTKKIKELEQKINMMMEIMGLNQTKARDGN